MRGIEFGKYNFDIQKMKIHNKSSKECINNLLLENVLENDAVVTVTAYLLIARCRGLPLVRLIYTHPLFVFIK